MADMTISADPREYPDLPPTSLEFPKPEVEAGGAMQITAWSYNRIARNGKGSVAGAKFNSASSTEELMPEGFIVYAHLGTHSKTGDDRFDVRHAENAEGIHLSIYSYGPVYKDVSAYSPDPTAMPAIDAVLHQVLDLAKPVPTVPDDYVSTEFWRLTSNGPASTARKLLVPEWPEISRNYSKDTQIQLEKLQEMTGLPDESSGNLIVLHGPAGTGKTTALRSLARSWKKWADCHYIIDPDNFLSLPDYLWTAVLSVSDITSPKWKLLIMEDVDELIRQGAKAQVGQSFSRLLNLADGFLGQGQRLVIVLTTNEPVNKLADAIMRPGRCLAHIEVPKLSLEESRRWMGFHEGETANLHSEYTLAELFEKKAKQHQIVSSSASTRPGQYL